MSRLVLDAGAFIAFERGDARMRARIADARLAKIGLVTTSPVVGQVWRDGRRQALLAVLLRATRIEAPSEGAARLAGELLARTRTEDVVDALVVLLARNGDTVVTADPLDLRVLLAATGTKATIVPI